MSKKIKIGNIFIGGGERIAIQTMSTNRIKDLDKCVSEANQLALSGCDILRYSVLDVDDALAVKELKKQGFRFGDMDELCAF